ncbi:FecR domain-containing protein, partial [Candidatus Dependentiae bacterium]|nr:FecR domain-containing protein [Candidatus Dependentiae bacterium]
MKFKQLRVLFIIILMAAIICSAGFAEEDKILLSKVAGKVMVKLTVSSEWEKAVQGMELKSQSKIKTSLNALAELSFDEGKTKFVIKENSEVVVNDYSTDAKTNAKNRDFKVNFGGVKFNVDKLKSTQSTFKVSTPSAVCGVRGTEGIIDSQGDEKPTKATLTEGQLFVTDENGSSGGPLDAGNTLNKNADGSSEYRQNKPEDTDDAQFKSIDPKYTILYEQLNAKWEEKKKEGYIIPTSLENNKKTVENFYSTRKFDKFEKDVNTLLKDIETLKKPENPFALELGKLRSEIEPLVAEKFGKFEIEKSIAKIKDVEELAKAGKFQEAVELIKTIINEIKTAPAKSEIIDIDKIIEQFNNELLDKGKNGFIINEAEAVFKRALMAQQSNNISEAASLIAEAKKALALARKKAPEGLMEKIQETEKLLNDKKTAGLSVDELFVILQFVKDSFASEKFVEAQESIEKIMQKIASLEGKKVIKKVALTLGDIQYLGKEAIIGGISDAGVDIMFDGVKIGPADAAGAFKKIIKMEMQPKTISLWAVNSENISSEKLTLTVKALEDKKAPNLVVSSPVYTANTVKITGFAEDDIELKSVKINNEAMVLNNGTFEKILVLSAEMQSVTVEAEDGTGKKTTFVVVLQDNMPPVIEITGTVIESGKIVIDGKVTDNIALKEVLVGGIPLSSALPAEGGVFKQSIVIAKEMIKNDGGKEVIEVKVKAVDKSGQVTEKSAKAELPADASNPELVWDASIQGNMVIVKGIATDNKPNDRGIAYLKINNEDVKIFEGGKFEKAYEVKIKEPKLQINEAKVDKAAGKFRVKGKLSGGEISPTKFDAEVADLGKPAHIVKQMKQVAIKFTVTANGQKIEVAEDGGFTVESPIEMPINIEVRQNETLFQTRFIAVPTVMYRSELKVPADAKDGLLTIELQEADASLLPAFVTEAAPNNVIKIEGAAFPNSLMPMEAAAALNVKYIIKNKIGTITHQGTVELKKAEEMPGMASLVKAGLKKIEIGIRMDKKDAIVYRGKMILDPAAKKGIITVEVSGGIGGIVKPINNEVVQATKEGKEIIFDAVISSGEAVVPEAMILNVKYADEAGNAYKNENVSLAKTAEILPEAILTTAPKSITIGTIPVPKVAILYSGKLRLPQTTRRGAVILESVVAGGIHLKPMANENIQIVAGGNEITILSGISSGEAVIPEGFAITVKYTDANNAAYKTENIILTKLPEVLPENALAAGVKYPVNFGITPVPPVAVLYSGKIKISDSCKDGEAVLEVTDPVGGIIKPISGLTLNYGSEVGIAAVISSEEVSMPEVLNISVKYIDKNGAAYTTDQPSKTILNKLPETLPYSVISAAQKSVKIGTIQKKSAVQFTGNVLISKDLKKGKVKFEITNATAVFLKPQDGANVVPNENVTVQAVMSNLEYTNQIPAITVTYYDEKDAAYSVTDVPVKITLTKSTAELPFDIIATGKNPINLVPASVTEKVYKYTGTLNIPADFTIANLTADMLKPVVTIDGKGIIGVSFDPAPEAEEYTIKWQFRGNAEASKIVAPVSGNVGKQIFKIDNMAGDGSDEIKMKPKFTTGSFVESEKIRLEWSNNEQYVDVWVVAKIKAAEAGLNKLKVTLTTSLTKGLMTSAPEGDIVSVNPVTINVYSLDNIQSLSANVSGILVKNGVPENKTYSPITFANAGITSEKAASALAEGEISKEFNVNMPNPNAGKLFIGAKDLGKKIDMDFEIYGSAAPKIPTVDNYEFKIPKNQLAGKTSHIVPELALDNAGAILKPGTILYYKDYNFIIVGYDASSRKTQISDLKTAYKMPPRDFVIKNAVQYLNNVKVLWEPDVSDNFGKYVVEYSYILEGEKLTSVSRDLLNKTLGEAVVPVYPGRTYTFVVKSYSSTGELLKTTPEYTYVVPEQVFEISSAIYSSSTNKATINWNAIVDNGTYKLFYTYTPGGELLQEYPGFISTTSAEIEVLSGKTYNFSVRLIENNLPTKVTPQKELIIPYNFRIMNAVSPDSDGIWIEWSDYQGAAYYIVKWTAVTVSGAPSYAISYSGQSIKLFPPYNNAYFVEDLAPGVSYNITIEAYNSSEVKISQTVLSNPVQVSTSSKVTKTIVFNISELRGGSADGSIFVKWPRLDRTVPEVTGYIVSTQIRTDSGSNEFEREYQVRLGLIDNFEFTGLTAGDLYRVSVIAVTNNNSVFYEAPEQLVLSKKTGITPPPFAIIDKGYGEYIGSIWVKYSADLISGGVVGYKAIYSRQPNVTMLNKEGEAFTKEDGIDLSIQIKGLVPETKYYFKVLSLGVTGNVINSTSEQNATSSNGTVGWFNISNISSNENGNVQIAWTTDSVDYTDFGVTGYRLVYDSVSLNLNSNKIDVGNVLSYTLTGMQPGMTYYFGIESYKIGGDIIHKTNQQQHTINAPAFSLQNVEVLEPGKVNVSWTRNYSGNYNYYRIEYKSLKNNYWYFSEPTDLLSSEIQNLNDNDTYIFRVQAMIYYNGTYSPSNIYTNNEIVKFIPAPEQPPVNEFEITMIENLIQGEVFVQWNPSQNYEVNHYKVIYSTHPEFSENIQSTDLLTDNAFTIMNIQYNDTYFFKVQGYINDVASGLPTPVAVRYILGMNESGPQENIYLSGYPSTSNYGAISLSWGHSLQNVYYYTITYETGPGTSFSLEKIVLNEIYASNNMYEITQLTQGQNYRVQIEAYNEQGQILGKSNFIENVSASTGGGSQESFEIKEIYNTSNQGEVYLEWTSSNYSGVYKVFRSHSSDPSMTNSTIVADYITDTLFIVNNILFGDTYYFRVERWDMGNMLEQTPIRSIYVNGQGGTGGDTLFVITNMNSPYTGEIYLEWSAYQGTFNYYKVLYANNYEMSNAQIAGEFINEAFFTITGLNVGETYYIQVEAWDAYTKKAQTFVVPGYANGSGTSGDVFAINFLNQQGDNSVFIGWNSNPELTVPAYRVEYQKRGEINWTPDVTIFSGNNATIFGITGGDTYQFRVQGVVWDGSKYNSYGEPTLPWEIYVTGSGTSQPNITMTLTDGNVGGSIEVNWNSYIQDVSFFKVWYERGANPDFSGNEYSSEQITGNYLMLVALFPDTSYKVEVRAYNSSGNEIGYSGIQIKNSAPNNISGTAFDITSYSRGPNNGEISLAWSADNSAGIIGYSVVYDSVSQINENSPRNFVNNNLQAVLSGLQPNIGYYIAVMSINENYQSANFSRGIYEYAGGSENVFELLQVTNNTPGNVSFEWRAYNGLVDEYRIQVRKNNLFATPEIIGSGITSTQYSINNLDYSDTYYVVVLAIYQGQIVGHTPVLSRYVCGFDQNSGSSFSITSITNPAAGQIYLQWANSTLQDVVKYTVVYSKNENFYNYESEPEIFNNFYTINNIDDSGLFYVRVNALDANGIIKEVTPYQTIEVIGVYIPEAIMLSSVQNLNQGEITISWTDNIPNLQYYKLWYDIGTMFTDNEIEVNLGLPSLKQWTITGLQPGEYYLMDMEAYDINGNVLAKSNVLYNVQAGNNSGAPQFEITQYTNPNPGEVQLVWTPYNGTVSNYQIMQSDNAD